MQEDIRDYILDDESTSDWNDGYWTEGLDRIHNAASIVEMMLCDHPSIVKAGLEEELGVVVDTLFEMYQKMGAAIPEEDW